MLAVRLRDLLSVLLLAGVHLLGQTTQGTLSGRVVSARSGRPLAATIGLHNADTGVAGAAVAGASGTFVLPLLSPGRYRLRVTAPGHQAQELQEIVLPVAGQLDVPFRLRPLSDVWEAGQYRSVLLPDSETVVTFYGPDLDTSRSRSYVAARGQLAERDTSVSQVIDTRLLFGLPLNGRDAYALLVTLPGVTADTATGRGLGLAIHGQRPSSSNFLLDGLENNNTLTTGPLLTVAPEAIQEYRVSTSNFSAEYGRTAGYVANVVSRSGTNAWHGLVYAYGRHETLSANDFGRDPDTARPRLRELQPGASVSGSIVRDRLFASAAVEGFRFRSQGDPESAFLPAAGFVRDFTAPGSRARRLLERFPAPQVSDGVEPIAEFRFRRPVSVNRLLALPRIDWVRGGGSERLLGRVVVARLERPDFLWTPYRDFITPLSQNTFGVGVGWLRTPRGTVTNELRAGFSTDELRFDRAHPEIPTLVAVNVFSPVPLVLPGSPAFYGYRNASRNIELVDNLFWARGRHFLRVGGGVLRRRVDGFLTAGRDARVEFDNPLLFGADVPSMLVAGVSRQDPRLLPRYEREYAYTQSYAYAQDSWRATPRLTLNAGLRYERFGAPHNVGGVKDALVVLGSGRTLVERLAGAELTTPASGRQRLYDPDAHWAGRFSFAYGLREDARTLLRGGYGVYHDRPFDNLWQTLRNNGLTLLSVPVEDGFDYLQPIGRTLQRLGANGLASDFPPLTLFQPGLRSPYAQHAFIGVQQRWSETWHTEVNVLSSYGRRLLTTDRINRPFTVPVTSQNPDGLPNPAFPQVAYRANQGLSNYHALAAMARYRGARSIWQVSYTLSRTIDTQSEPLAGDFFDLSFTNLRTERSQESTAGLRTAAFTRPFDSRGDRASSDFDQRHNLVVLALWEVPGMRRSAWLQSLTNGWTLAPLAAFRSGFPYSVFAAVETLPGGVPLEFNRADLVAPHLAAARRSEPGGVRLLNPEAFAIPAPGRVGTSGRNAFRGPGLFSIDLSVSRTLPLPWAREGIRLLLRADAFNLLNHANLDNPDAFFSSDNETFGVSRYGRRGRGTGFPAALPLSETARQVQLLLRLEF